MARYDYGYRGYGAYGYGGYGYGGPGYYTGYGPGYGYTGWGTRAGYGAGRGGYDRADRRPPEESPTYGRGGDRAARRYARSRGYDAGYSVQPNRSDRFGGYYGTRNPAGRGGYGSWGNPGYRGWNERDYDWGYRW